MAGWIFDIDPLKSVLPGLATMKANTALAILLEGAALALLAVSPVTGWKRATARAAAAAAGAGALTLLEFATGANLGIDEILATSPAMRFHITPTAWPPTALNFVLLASPRARRNAERAAGSACEASAIAAS